MPSLISMLHRIREAQSALAAIARPETHRDVDRVSLDRFLEQLPDPVAHGRDPTHAFAAAAFAEDLANSKGPV